MVARPVLHLLVVGTVSAVVLFTQLGRARLWDRDEPRNAGCAREMMARGDYVVPMFNDELRAQKPVLLYWLIAASYQLFGVNEFAARFSSALLAVGTSLLTYLLIRRLFDWQSGVLSAIVLTTSLMFVVAGRAATPDSVLIFCQTSALFIYIRQVFDSDPSRRPESWFPKTGRATCALYSVTAIGVLAKGLIGIVMPMAIIGMFMLIKRLPVRAPQSIPTGILSQVISLLRPFHPLHVWRTFLAMRPGIAVLMTLVIAGPWYLAVGMKTQGDFLRMFFLNEHLGRATSSFESHSGGVWYYPLAIALGFFPWSIFLLPTGLSATRLIAGRRLQASAVQFLVTWVGVQVTVFTLVATKLPSYVTPAYPALAGLTAVGLIGLCRNASWVSRRIYALTIPVVGTASVMLIVGLELATRSFLGGAIWLAGSGLIWTAVALFGWRVLATRQSPLRWVVAYSIGAVAFCLYLFAFGAAAVDRVRQSECVLAAVREAAPETPFATYRCLESSWVYYAQRPIWELAPDPQSASNDTAVRATEWAPKPRVSPAQFVALHPQTLILTTDEHWQELDRLLNGRYEIIATAPYFLRNKQLVLSAPISAVGATAHQAQRTPTRR